MPLNNSKDKTGYFFRWGKVGKKYYYKPFDKTSREIAKNHALKQQRAIFSNKNDILTYLLK